MAQSVKNEAPLLHVERMSVAYGRHQALKDISLNIQPGELVGIIGPNGAGKTSFVKALCGHVHSTGQIKIADKPIKRGQDRRALIGLVPQDIGLYPQLTARENLDVMARLLGVDIGNRKARTDEVLASVGMTEKQDALVSALSGGMKRRINVAAAIMHAPSVVIFDEPTAGIDIPARDVVHRLARQQAQTGKAVILITHELEQAEALCDKILLLRQGDALAFGSPADILETYYGSQRTARLRFAAPPNAQIHHALKDFEFREGELPTIWQTETDMDERFFVQEVMNELSSERDSLREISVGRPGLNSLMHDIETVEPMAL
jgi:ABC-2 type transport system ATP-binding protein